MDNRFKTLRGFLNNHEPEQAIYLRHSATLRIFGNIPDLEEISRNLGLRPTASHFKGETRAHHSRFSEDMWSYTASVDKGRPLGEHIDALWKELKPHKKYLLGLKKSLRVDVFLGYQSNSDHAGIEVPHTSLDMFSELQIPFGLSIIIA